MRYGMSCMSQMWPKFMKIVLDMGYGKCVGQQFKQSEELVDVWTHLGQEL